MTDQLSLFDLPIKKAPVKKETEIKKEWYNINGYKDPGLVTLVMSKWVKMDESKSPCHYARVCMQQLWNRMFYTKGK